MIVDSMKQLNQLASGIKFFYVAIMESILPNMYNE